MQRQSAITFDGKSSLLAVGALCLGAIFPVRADDAVAAPSGPAATPAWAQAGREAAQGIPFPDLVEAVAGYPVLPWRGESGEALREAAGAAVNGMRETPVRAGRVNEVGLRVEDRLAAALTRSGFTVGIPRTQSGRQRSTGYPDLVARRDGQTFYIEVKTFSGHTRDSGQRTFYFSPSDDPKIREAAYHLLFGFEMEPLGDDAYRPERVEVLDLSGLVCALKVEFNASNRDLYDGALTVFSAEASDQSAPAAE